MFDLKLLKRIDWFTILLVVGLVTFGLISIASIMASPFSGEESSIGDYTAKLNMVYVNKQTVNFMVGAAAFLIIIVFDYQQVFKPLIKFAYIGIVGLLVLLIVMDKTQRGITGWFVFEAIDRAIQPGELCKICVIIALSKIAIGSGQLYGKGYFSSGTLAQLRFVPERHTDFVFAGIVEGVGFVGGVLLIVAFFLLIFRWIWIAMHAKDYFGMCLVAGCAGMLLAHVFENIGMTIGLMPVTGIPLPFISYGGSNLLTNMIAVGIVENVWMRRPEKK